MSPSDVNESLREDNYFVWEFNARMKLAKKGLLDHLDAAKAPSEADPGAAGWKVNDMKAYAIVTTMISPSFQSMVRSASSAAQAWEILKNFFLRRSIHNRVQMRRQVHEFKMEKGSNVMTHLLKFDELCMSMQAIGDEIKADEQLVLLLGSLSEDYDQIVKIIENMEGMDLFRAKEMIQREYDGLQRKEGSEIALKATKKSRTSVRMGRSRRNSRGSATCAIVMGTGRATAGTIRIASRPMSTPSLLEMKSAERGCWIVVPQAT